MRDLHVVGVADDGRHLVLATSPDSAGDFRIVVDDRLHAAMRGEVTRATPDEPRPQSALTPREIQARLRAGDSPEEVAAAAGVSVDRVARYAVPVLAERARVIDEVRASVLARSRSGPASLPLGEAVDARLAALAALNEDTVSWAAGREEDGSWTVQVFYVVRGRGKSARWSWDPVTHVVSALDQASGAMGHRVEPVAPAAALPVRPSLGGAARPAAATRDPRPVRPTESGRVSGPTPAHGGARPKAIAKPRGAKAAGPRPKVTRIAGVATSRGAAAGRRGLPAGSHQEPPALPAMPATEPAVPPEARPQDRAGGNPPMRLRRRPGRPAGAPAPTPREPVVRSLMPTSDPLPATVPPAAEPAAADATRPGRPAHPARARSGRATVPAWADVLLGTSASQSATAKPDDERRTAGERPLRNRVNTD